MRSDRRWRVIGSTAALLAATAGVAGALKTGWLPSRPWGAQTALPAAQTAVLPDVSTAAPGPAGRAAADRTSGESPASEGLWPVQAGSRERGETAAGVPRRADSQRPGELGFRSSSRARAGGNNGGRRGMGLGDALGRRAGGGAQGGNSRRAIRRNATEPNGAGGVNAGAAPAAGNSNGGRPSPSNPGSGRPGPAAPAPASTPSAPAAGLSEHTADLGALNAAATGLGAVPIGGSALITGAAQVASTPEPASILLIGTGLAMAAGAIRRRRRH
jgi:hypothetical protein